jgi:hypothetical protein
MHLPDGGLTAEAADEIERLQGLLKAKVTPGYELLADQIEKRDAEIERLRTDKHQLIAVAADEMTMRDAEIERLRAALGEKP